MSLPVPSTSINLEFADGVYTFRLGLKQIAELQTKCGCGIGALYARVLKGRYQLGDGSFGHTGEGEYRIEDLIETHRQGLIGGGQGEVDGQPVAVTSIVANRLVANYVEGRPLTELWNTAAAILHTCVEGYSKKKAPPLNPESEPGTTQATVGSITPGQSPTAP